MTNEYTAASTVTTMLYTLNCYLEAHPDTPRDKLLSALETELIHALKLDDNTCMQMQTDAHRR